MIVAKNISKIYFEGSKKEFYALKSINFEIKKGSFVIFKGVSGSGKSTLLSIIATISKPSLGEILFENESVSKYPDIHASNVRAKNIGYIFQSFNLFEDLTVFENVSFPLIPLGFSQKEINKKVEETLILSNILHKKDEIVSNLSGGEKQRCAIARALVNKADAILCDEPTSSLDFENSLNFIESLKELKKAGKTIVVATHDPIFFELDFVDKFFELKNGVLIE
ncbi:ABC transporter ATP-binding protein [Aliarcobacter cryaerophilus ATCC 43158]|uniref:ABC transporter, ATP-binding protein, FtsE/LolD family n=1 Tax=Aliarcobacter cryaerophilus ATCC 43158 TaxID=1032070 RepID=A0AAD0U0I6_9BACT|nr:ABC transporter ATP-binding protein [Aliarcobacter cryaerophilus]AYJ80817.1 ABC transporter, ATP-binding protein, FtsE/LolD family [Aliarcobacter cryaerophilus ATCC 43158]PRM98314.1 ABC transporter ATP-binding protein [Aliarcobacter cryaerophilus]QCZ23145.1 ABC transporter ATP-binding protein [Aliarcobacter cryaerophilus ATCC 43158]